MEISIINQDDLRGAATVLNQEILAMCNATSVTEVTDKFMNVKDYLISIYRYKVASTSGETTT